jgi:hypothetical protein
MLINKDHDHPHAVRISFGNSHERAAFQGPLTRINFGKAQYQWHANRRHGYADPDQPPVTSTLNVDANTSYELPAASLTILRGKLQSATPQP